MKMCNSEAMKAIKELEQKKRNVLYIENNRSRVAYKEGEKRGQINYDYVETRKTIAGLDEKIRSIKHALAVCNCTAIVNDFGITIGEALVYLAQLNAEYDQLDDLSNHNKISRTITYNGVIEYTECLYDPDEVIEEMEALHAKICKLQVSIDRANLTNYIEV